MGGLIPAIVTIYLDCHFPTIAGHAAISSIRPPRSKQGSATLYRRRPRRQPCLKDEVADLHMIGTATPPSTRNNLQTNTCKNPATPCGYKRGGRVPLRDHRTPDKGSAHGNTHTQATDSTPHLSSEYHSVYFSKPRLGT